MADSPGSPAPCPPPPPPTPELGPLPGPPKPRAPGPLSPAEVGRFLAAPRGLYYAGLTGPAVAQLRAETAARLGEAHCVVAPWWALNSGLDRLQEFRRRHGRDPAALPERPRRRALVALGAAAAALGLEAPRLAEALGLPGAQAGAQLEVAETGYDPERCAACKGGVGPDPRLAVYSGRNEALLGDWGGLGADGLGGLGSLEALELHPEEEALQAVRLVCAGCAGCAEGC